MKRLPVPMAMADETACCNLKTTLDLLGLFFCIFVFLLVVLVYVRHLLLWRLSDGGAALDRLPQKAGLDPSAIAALPSFAYQQRRTGESGVTASKAKSTAVECAVCLSTAEEGETLRVLPACEHIFHAQCIDLWLLSKSTCPICRAEAQPVVKAASSSATEAEVRIGETTLATKEENAASSSSSSLFQGMWSARLRFGDLESNSEH